MFDTVNIDGVVVIGEGEKDEAPMLYIGEEIGMGGTDATKVDIAVDPLDGTTSTAKGCLMRLQSSPSLREDVCITQKISIWKK